MNLQTQLERALREALMKQDHENDFDPREIVALIKSLIAVACAADSFDAASAEFDHDAAYIGDVYQHVHEALTQLRALLSEDSK